MKPEKNVASPYIRKRLESVDMTKAPPIIDVDYGSCSVKYYKQPLGYFGIPRIKKNVQNPTNPRRRLRPGSLNTGHMIVTVGDHRGWVYTKSTNKRLAKVNPLSKKERSGMIAVGRVIDSGLHAVLAAIELGAPECQDINSLTDLPPWLVLERGIITELDITTCHACGLGSPDYVTKFAQITEHRPVIDIKRVLNNILGWRAQDFVATSGVWDEESEFVSMTAMLDARLVGLAKTDGLRIMHKSGYSERTAPPRPTV